jgi:hypothetical protein
MASSGDQKLCPRRVSKFVEIWWIQPDLNFEILLEFAKKFTKFNSKIWTCLHLNFWTLCQGISIQVWDSGDLWVFDPTGVGGCHFEGLTWAWYKQSWAWVLFVICGWTQRPNPAGIPTRQQPSPRLAMPRCMYFVVPPPKPYASSEFWTPASCRNGSGTVAHATLFYRLGLMVAALAFSW